MIFWIFQPLPTPPTHIDLLRPSGHLQPGLGVGQVCETVGRVGSYFARAASSFLGLRKLLVCFFVEVYSCMAIINGSSEPREMYALDRFYACQHARGE